MNWDEMNSEFLVELLNRALGKDLGYPDLDEYYEIIKNLGHSFDQLKPAAVLILFGFNKGVPAILYTKRTEKVEKHKGQMSFPGGTCDPEDLHMHEVTALRETEEEVGISREKVRILGGLPALPTVTGYLIHPILGILKEPVESIELRLSESETEEAVWVPVKVLTHSATYRLELKEFETSQLGLVQYPVHVYQIERHKIWGATASLTKNLIDRLSSLE